jgi:hypothetical protein
MRASSETINSMQLGDHLGFAGVVLAAAGIGIAILWPSKRWIGVVCLVVAVLLVICWGEMAYRSWRHPFVESSIPKTAPPSNSPQSAPLAESPRASASKIAQPPLPQLIFSDSPLFTPQRKEHIEAEIDAFRAYLRNAGFDVSQQVFPISVAPYPGKVVGMSHFSPGDVYDGKIRIGEKAIDDPPTLRLAYSYFYFVTIVGNVRTAEGLSSQLEEIYRTYFLESFSGKPFVGHSEWNDALWDLREQFGAKTTDKALCIGLQRRVDSLMFKSANAYTANVVERGFEPFVNDVMELKKIDKTIEKYGLMPPPSS